MNAAYPPAPTKDLAVVLDGCPCDAAGVNCGVPSIGWPCPPCFIETIVEPYPGDVPARLDEAKTGKALCSRDIAAFRA
eukprot:scaffold94095_cov73-Phaeocystis_antarctica.AAC.1